MRNAQDIKGGARIIAGAETYTNVPYRIGIVEKHGKRSIVAGTIEVAPGVLIALRDKGECAIELGSVLGWFRFLVTDVHRGEIKLVGSIKVRARRSCEKRSASPKDNHEARSIRDAEVVAVGT
jgi:hypothetical protein